MHVRDAARVLVLSFSLAAAAAACGDHELPTRPSATPSELAVVAVTPNRGFARTVVQILGTGFVLGATVTVGGQPAVETDVIGPTRITAVFSGSNRGTVDVGITNPDGRTATLVGGYTFEPFTLAPTLTVVSPRQQFAVTWSVPSDRGGRLDWIGLFALGDANTDFEKYWWAYVSGTSGTVELTAPAAPGQYELRYLVNDGYVDIARSGPITVR